MCSQFTAIKRSTWWLCFRSEISIQVFCHFYDMYVRRLITVYSRWNKSVLWVYQSRTNTPASVLSLLLLVSICDISLSLQLWLHEECETCTKTHNAKQKSTTKDHSSKCRRRFEICGRNSEQLLNIRCGNTTVGLETSTAHRDWGARHVWTRQRQLSQDNLFKSPQQMWSSVVH